MSLKPEDAFVFRYQGAPAKSEPVAPVLLKQMDAYALMKARQGIAREIMENRSVAKHWRETNAIEAETFCYETIFALRELANHQFSHRPTIPPVTTGEHIRRGWLYSNYGRD